MSNKNDSNKCKHQSDLCHYVSVNWGIIKLEVCHMLNNINYKTKCNKCGEFYHPDEYNNEE